MVVKINGEEKELSDGITLGECLKELNIKAGMVATEVNQLIVKRAEREKYFLKEHDSIEIVRIIGGG